MRTRHRSQLIGAPALTLTVLLAAPHAWASEPEAAGAPDAGQTPDATSTTSSLTQAMVAGSSSAATAAFFAFPGERDGRFALSAAAASKAAFPGHGTPLPCQISRKGPYVPDRPGTDSSSA